MLEALDPQTNTSQYDALVKLADPNQREQVLEAVAVSCKLQAASAYEKLLRKRDVLWTTANVNAALDRMEKEEIPALERAKNVRKPLSKSTGRLHTT